MTTELLTETTTNYAIGLILAISSCFFIGASFIIKKKALIKSALTGQRASKGGYGYLKEFQWWCGLVSMGAGELLNFTAYAFAPASLITPLGALSILVTAVLASYYLNEKLSLISKLGCVLCITGSIFIVLHAPKEGEIDGLKSLGRMIMSFEFLIYMIFIAIVSLVLVYYSPKYGDKSVVIYVLICSLIGSLSVMACKGIGIALVETINGVENNFKNPLFYFLLILLITTITIQMNYLNKALDTFETFVVTPVYYVFFTTFVLIASSILFQEWKNLQFADVLGTISGFVNVIVAIFMLNAFKNTDSNLNEIISSISRPKYEKLSSSDKISTTISLKS